MDLALSGISMNRHTFNTCGPLFTLSEVGLFVKPVAIGDGSRQNPACTHLEPRFESLVTETDSWLSETVREYNRKLVAVVGPTRLGTMLLSGVCRFHENSYH